jgi:glutaredoxin/uncharacterized protein (UPF0333 family)
MYFLKHAVLVSMFLGTLLVGTATPVVVRAAVESPVTAPTVYVFGRDDCGFCKAERAYLEGAKIPYVYLNVVDDEAAQALFHDITAKHELSRVTPITVVGAEVFQGFNGAETTGKQIADALVRAAGTPYVTIEDHLRAAPKASVNAGSGCDEFGVDCVAGTAEFVFDLPFVGLVDLKSFSLLTLSLVLGVIDGFNPCAMWVLITFLVLLTQAGSKQKMVTLAGVFIVAEAIMYNLILNVWYKTWDFVALDQIVTPLVGVLAMGGGSFFLWRWYNNRKVALVCDITSLDSQARTIDKLKRVINAPLTLTTIGAILVIAFSVNIIEFACSIGIPQAYTKILELNLLTFVERQWYIMVYTFGYMVDDFVVFGLAIWGFSKLEAHGHKYAQLSLIIGGVLMLLLGALLTFAPDLLVL